MSNNKHIVEMLYTSFKHEFEVYLDRGIDYEELKARLSINDDEVDAFTERYWSEDYVPGILAQVAVIIQRLKGGNY